VNEGVHVKSDKWIVPLILSAAMAATGQKPPPARNPTLTVKTIGGQTLTLGAQDLAKLTQVKVSAKDHERKDHEYAGVNLRDILTKAGVAPGHDLRGKEMADYVLV
jgi:hypothetical protein